MHTAFEKVQSYPCCLLKGSKLSTLLSSCRYASVHFHHVVGISISYRRGENSTTTWRFSTKTLCTLVFIFLYQFLCSLTNVYWYFIGKPQAAIGTFIIVVKGLNPGVGSAFTGEEQYIKVREIAHNSYYSSQSRSFLQKLWAHQWTQ